MTVSQRLWIPLAVGCIFQAGWIIGGWATPFAHAEPTTETAPLPTQEEWVYRCKSFSTDLTKDDTLSTDDNTTPAGMWVRGERKRGWTLAQVDFEVGQKVTGYPQGWTQVCVKKLDS